MPYIDPMDGGPGGTGIDGECCFILFSGVAKAVAERSEKS